VLSVRPGKSDSLSATPRVSAKRLPVPYTLPWLLARQPILERTVELCVGLAGRHYRCDGQSLRSLPQAFAVVNCQRAPTYFSWAAFASASCSETLPIITKCCSPWNGKSPGRCHYVFGGRPLDDSNATTGLLPNRCQMPRNPKNKGMRRFNATPYAAKCRRQDLNLHVHG
jgi:hypothetical protein